MILNRIIVPEYNDITFLLDHTENGEKHVLDEGSRYYIIISEAKDPFDSVVFHEFDSEYCTVPAGISNGEYTFEIGIIDGAGNRRVILPALDERLRPLNQLLVLRRMKYVRT